MRVVATAGHVDHGKSTLVRALTGTDPDRFAEEKARGLTIDLGFAFTTLPSGQVIGFVDVPGHVRFVKNMLAGVGAVDVAMLVVAANEGWMPQTAEHVEILDLLDIRHGVVALTKADVVDAETLELAQVELAERVDAHPAVDMAGGPGRRPERSGHRRTPGRARRGDPCRTTAARQRPAEVVGGSRVLGARFGHGRDRHPHRRVARRRLRSARSSGRAHRGECGASSRTTKRPNTSRRGAGSRSNLAGLERADVARGSAVVLPGQWVTPTVTDVAVRAVHGAELPARGPVDVHIGSGEHAAALRIVDRSRGFARLTLPVALPLAPGDRMVLRSSARRETMGGAEVLDVAPTRRARDAPARLGRPLAARVVDARPWTETTAFAALTGLDRAEVDEFVDAACARDEIVRVDRWLVAPVVLARLRDQVADAVGEPAGAHGVELATLASATKVDNAQLRAALVDEPRVVVEQDVVRAAGHESVTEDPAARAVVDALTAHPFAPPEPATVGASPALVRALVRSGTLVELDGIYFARVAYEQVVRLVSREVVARGSLTVSDVRDLLGSSRKYVVPLLTKLDADGITRRRGDVRIPGARVSRVGDGDDARPR